MPDLMELHTTWGGVAGSPYYTTLRCLVGGTISAQEFCDAWEDVLVARNVDFANQIIATIETELTVIDAATGVLVGTDTCSGATVPGVSSGDPVPLATQALVRWGTGLVIEGVRLRGRTFLPHIIESHNSDLGQPTSAFKDAWATVLAAFITALDNQFVVYSRTHHQYSSVTSGAIWSEWAVLRSRRD